MKLSIIVINYGKFSYSLLTNCLASIAENLSRYDCSCETIVIDSEYNSAEITELKKIYNQVSFHTFEENLGFSKAANYGLQVAKGDYCLTLNYDIILKPDTIKKIYSFLDDKPDFAIASLKLLNSDGSLQFSKGKYPTISRIFTGLFKPIAKRKWDTLGYDEVSCPDWVSASAIIVNHKRLKSQNIFDESFFMYYEDVDLCYNLKKAGERILYLPGIEVYHTNPFHRRINDDEKLFYEIRKSQLYFFYKNYGKNHFYALKLCTVLFITFKFLCLGFLKIFFSNSKQTYYVYQFVLREIIHLNFATLKNNS